MLRTIPFFVFLFTFLSGYTQPLPLYELSANGEYLLMRSNKPDTLPRMYRSTLDTVSLITAKGIWHGKFIKQRWITQKECCTKPDPQFLVASVRFKDKNVSGILLEGNADSGRLFNYDSLKAKTNLFEWISEEFSNPLINKEVITRYRWTAAEPDGKKDVFLQAKSKNNGKEYIDTYNILLKNCLHIKADSVDFFYCPTDTAGNYRKKELHWFNDVIYMSLFYMNHKLIYAIPDFSHTSIDGYGPFHSKEQKLSAAYFSKGTRFFYFSPGYVIYNKNKEWKLTSREPVKYYGECDCGE